MFYIHLMYEQSPVIQKHKVNTTVKQNMQYTTQQSANCEGTRIYKHTYHDIQGTFAKQK